MSCIKPYLLFFLLIPFSWIGQKVLANAQNDSPDLDSIVVRMENFPLRYRTSFELLPMEGEASLGMLSIGADWFILKPAPNLYLSLNTVSAVSGRRPGLITFGTGLGYLQPLVRSKQIFKWALDAGAYVGGGGGAGAPDGGGLITRVHANLLFRQAGWQVFGGLSRMDFPTGQMGGLQMNFGLAFEGEFRTASRISHKNSFQVPEDSQRLTLYSLRASTQQYIHLTKRALGESRMGTSFQATDVRLLGFELNRYFSETPWFASLKLHGAVSGGMDGYMSYVLGVGYDLPFGKSLDLQAQLGAGPSGGGAANTGGGAIAQGSLSLQAAVSRSYALRAGLGHTHSLGGSFRGEFVEIGVSKSLRFASKAEGEWEKLEHQVGDGERWRQFIFALGNRTYFSYGGDRELDKSGRPYDKAFQLIGVSVGSRLSPFLEGIGESYWAYQGSYGAYAEGLLGLRAQPFPQTGDYESDQKWMPKVKILVGAAGGGGIDLGSGLVFQTGLELNYSSGSRWGLHLGGGKIAGLRGNFRPLYLDFGLNYRFGAVQIP